MNYFLCIVIGLCLGLLIGGVCAVKMYLNIVKDCESCKYRD